LITPYPYTVPATIRSRVRLVHTENMGFVATPFSVTNRTDMLELVKKEFGSESDDDAATRRARAVELLDTLEHHVKGHPIKAVTIYTAKKLLLTANMPTKFVLEYAVSVVL
jgi:hypothetical protein